MFDDTFEVNVGSHPITFGSCVGSVLGHYWVTVRSFLGHIGDHFGVTFGSLLGHFRHHFGVTFGSLLDHFGDHSGVTPGSLLDTFSADVWHVCGTRIRPGPNSDLEALDPTVREDFSRRSLKWPREKI